MQNIITAQLFSLLGYVGNQSSAALVMHPCYFVGLVWVFFFPNPMRFVERALFGEICIITGSMLLTRSGWMGGISPELGSCACSSSSCVLHTLAAVWGEPWLGAAAPVLCVGWVWGV